MTKRTVFSIAASGALLLPWLLAAQSAEEGVRQLWNSMFFERRPPGKSKAKTPPKNVAYKAVGAAAKGTATPGVSETLLGVTLWRLRPPRPADDPGARLLVIEEESPTGAGSETVPERIDLDTPLAEGDRVRLTVEVPRTGYLYVIDRELYSDGASSPPYLIYPNYKTRPGDNAVAAGRLIEIPDQRDSPNHFRIRRGKPNQTAEVLTMLVTNEPLSDLVIGKEPLKLSEDRFRDWENKYGVQAERFELAGGEGVAYSRREKEAGADGASRLTRDDPMPQTLYRVPAAQGQPILISVPVKIRK
jgi:hypothetical protein